jgi:DNA-binding FadR family transcriptional regulator
MDLFDTLVDEIVTGKHPIGALLPSERDLAQTHNVSRQAVRDVIGRLASLQLVTQHHGAGNRVADWRSNGTVELLPYFLKAGAPGTDPVILMRELLRMRIYPASEIVRLAATYAPAETFEKAPELLQHAWLMRAHPREFAAADIELLRHFAVGANLAPATWLFNSFLPAYRILIDRFVDWVVVPKGYVQTWEEIIKAMAKRKADLASKKLTEFLKANDVALFKKLGA